MHYGAESRARSAAKRLLALDAKRRNALDLGRLNARKKINAEGIQYRLKARMCARCEAKRDKARTRTRFRLLYFIETQDTPQKTIKRRRTKRSRSMVAQNATPEPLCPQTKRIWCALPRLRVACGRTECTAEKTRARYTRGKILRAEGQAVKCTDFDNRRMLHCQGEGR